MTIADVMQVCSASADVMADAAQPLVAGYTSDLLSDIMAHATEGCVLITIQNHRNTVAVATLVDAKAILLCHNRPIPQDMATAAQAEAVAILRTPLNQFEATCRIGAALEG